MGDKLRALWTMLMAEWLGPRPDVAEAVQQQRAVTGDTHSRKVSTENYWQHARLLADAGLYHSAALCLIAASGNGTARVVEEEHA